MKRWIGWAVLLLAGGSAAAASTCYGTPVDGALVNGCRLPAGGANFSPYTSLGRLLGRMWVHCTVAEVVEAAYAALASSHPERRYVLAESGLERGGEFRPHKTHRNGLSVDFMVPVLDRSGRSVPLPTGLSNRFGYDLEFDAQGRQGELRIDFEALAAHLAALHDAAGDAGIGLRRVIFDPGLQPALRETAAWPEIQELRFSTRRSWVRHDEHYHVDFDVPCEPMDQRPR